MPKDKPALPEWAVPGLDVITLSGRSNPEPREGKISRVTKSSVFVKRGTGNEIRFVPEWGWYDHRTKTRPVELVEYGHSYSYSYSPMRLTQVGSDEHLRSAALWRTAQVDRAARAAADKFAGRRTLETAAELQTALSAWVEEATKTIRETQA
jgi:hypothetical protein